MQQAILAMESGMSQRLAVKTYGIPRATLQDRLAGAVSMKEHAADRQHLSEAQEKDLARWSHVQEALGLVPTHYQLRRAAEEILRASGTPKKLGKNWTTNFQKRNPSVKIFQGKILDSKRAKDVTPDRIRALFEVLDGPFSVISGHNIDTIWTRQVLLKG